MFANIVRSRGVGTVQNHPVAAIGAKHQAAEYGVGFLRAGMGIFLPSTLNDFLRPIPLLKRNQRLRHLNIFNQLLFGIIHESVINRITHDCPKCSKAFEFGFRVFFADFIHDVSILGIFQETLEGILNELTFCGFKRILSPS